MTACACVSTSPATHATAPVTVAIPLIAFLPSIQSWLRTVMSRWAAAVPGTVLVLLSAAAAPDGAATARRAEGRSSDQPTPRIRPRPWSRDVTAMTMVARDLIVGAQPRGNLRQQDAMLRSSVSQRLSWRGEEADHQRGSRYHECNGRADAALSLGHGFPSRCRVAVLASGRSPASAGRFPRWPHPAWSRWNSAVMALKWQHIS
jgi:hypothetical protein